MLFFVIPSREDRIKILNSGMLAWLYTSEKEFRYDPDSYILTLSFRHAIKISFIIGLIAFLLSIFLYSNNNLFYEFRGNLSTLAPFSVFIPIYYAINYYINIDKCKYNPLIIKKTGKKIPNSFISIFVFPLSVAVMLASSYFAYHIYDTDALSKLEIFYDSY